MSSEKVIIYNNNSSRKFGWTPEWFGANAFDNNLIDKIKEFQKENNLTEDGMCGSATFRRIFTQREANIEEYAEKKEFDENNKHIVFNGKFFPISWKKVVLWGEEGGLKAKKGNYREVIGEPREIKLFVNHWDVCLSSKSCQKVLDQRGLSVTFLIDNDGTIYQTCDMQHITWHTGNQNKFATGVEISNAYYIKYNDWYIKNGFGERPIKRGTVRGKELEDHLGFYPIQIEAAKALWKAVADACDIPMRCPLVDGKEHDGFYDPAARGEWKGFIHHYNVANNKIDCGGLSLREHLNK